MEFLAVLGFFVYLGINAGRIMTCLSKGNGDYDRNKMKPPLSRGSRKASDEISTSVVSLF
jgi:hypothetical protein